MTHRSGGLERFISRVFSAAAGAIIVVTGVFLALYSRRTSGEGWVQESRELSRLAREISIRVLRRESNIAGNLSTGAPLVPEIAERGRQEAELQLDTLRLLAAGRAEHVTRVQRITRAYARWDSILISSASGSGPGARRPMAREAIVASEPSFQAMLDDLDALIRSEEQLYGERLASAHVLDRVIVVFAFLALTVILVTLTLLHDRMVSQAREISLGSAALDLRNAQLIDQTAQLERALNELQTSETRFRTLVQSLHDVVSTAGPDKRYTGMYGGYRSGLPIPLDMYVGKTPVEIMGPEAGAVHDEAADRALKGTPTTYDWQTEYEGEQHFLTTSVTPLRDGKGVIQGVVGITRDLTEQVQRDRALSEARDRLRQSQRIEALGQLAGGVAHDFNNLLTVIMTYAAMLQDETAPGSDDSRSIEEIRLASERAAALTRQLLAFSRRQVLQPRALDLNDTVRAVEQMLRRLIPPDIVLETNLDPRLGLVMADPGQMEQVLVNLALNSRDAMPEGGRIIITTTNASGRLSQDAVGNGILGPHARLTVSDTGIGMSRETAAQVFEPFFTTKGFGNGTGLGLATVHGIIEQSGGRISVESQVGRGTTFTIQLPRVAATAKQLSPGPTTPPELRGSETLLLIDDNEELRRVVKRMLRRSGYEVIEASNGAAGLAILDRGTHVDIVVSDVMMPEMSGRAVVDAIRQRHRDVKVLLMSGYNYDTALHGMARSGDVAFIEKPFTAEKMLQKLREVLGQPQESGVA